MNKKGFTLVELLAVIAILGIVITIAATSVTAIRNSSLKKIVSTKVNDLEAAAIVYGQKNQSSMKVSECASDLGIALVDGKVKYSFDYFEKRRDDKDDNNHENIVHVDTKFCKVVTVGKLIEEKFYETKEVNSAGESDLINNVTGKSMKNDKILIYRKNNRIYAVMYEINSYKVD